MRLALIGPYPPPFGGVSSTLLQLNSHLSQENFAVKVFSTSNMLRDCSEKNVGYASMRSILPSENFLWQIYRFQPTLIHSHNSTVGLASSIAARILNVPLIHHIHGERFPTQFASMSSLQRLRVKWMINEATTIVVVSQELAEFVRTVYNRSSIEVVPSLLPLEVSYEQLIDQQRLRPKQMTIVTTGYYPFGNSHYGFSMIPKVAKDLKSRGVDYRWYIVGQGSTEEITGFADELARLGVSDSVTYVGELDRPELLGLLARSHAYVRTKYSDSFGIVIAEAHQLGCFCIFGDNNPYFVEGERLIKYVTGDATDLTMKLVNLASILRSGNLVTAVSPFELEARANYSTIKQIYSRITSRI